MEWYEIIKSNAPNATSILVGGKLDIEDKRVVSKEDAEEFQKINGINYYIEASSKTGYNNKLIFQTLSEAIYNKL